MGHRVLITGRTLALQSIERNMPANLDRVEILPMDEPLQQQWFKKWSFQVGINTTKRFQEFLQDKNCPERVQDLAKEPLLLYLLAAMHRDGKITIEMFADTKATQAKILIYQKSLDWVLTEERPEWLQRKIVEHDIEDLRRILTEAGLCVVQSGGEYTAISMIEERLKNSDAKALLDEARERIGDNPLRNTLAAFYLQPGKQTGSVEFAHKSFSEFLYAERLKESLEEWTETGNRGRGFKIQQQQIDWEIYDLLGYGGLTPEIVEYLMGLLTGSNTFRPVELFQRLEDFYHRWCQGEFIDAPPTDNQPMKKMLNMKANASIGLKQVDIYAGLNVMILLLKLHRYAQERNDLKQQIHFYPLREQDVKNTPKDQVLRIIYYSDSIKLGTFCSVVGRFLSAADLQRAYLQRADLQGADLQGAYLQRADLQRADLQRADLQGANLQGAYLLGANLLGANLQRAFLQGAYLQRADLQGAYLQGANLQGADLQGANLQGADLQGAYLQGAYLQGADLQGAYLQGADLQRAYLSYAKNLNPEQVQQAENWNLAQYSEEFRAQLGLPPEANK